MLLPKALWLSKTRCPMPTRCLTEALLRNMLQLLATPAKEPTPQLRTPQEEEEEVVELVVEEGVGGAAGAAGVAT